MRSATNCLRGLSLPRTLFSRPIMVGSAVSNDARPHTATSSSILVAHGSARVSGIPCSDLGKVLCLDSVCFGCSGETDTAHLL